MERKYKYDAFISYRHTELDKFVAENLHKQLETFHLPGSIAKKHKGEKTRIERVFRDKEELPLAANLEDPIIDALQNSEWLIVICTPRLRESLWCKKEIETFIQLRDREHVLAVLAEGEPWESFPDELLYKLESYTMPDGSIQEVKVPVEPLAADMRGTNNKQVLKAMDNEKLRLLAAMFGLTYDDLRQRHRERKMRRIITFTTLGAAACLLFGVYSTATALKIKKQNQQIEAQSVEIQKQSDSIKKQSEEIAEQNSELAHRQALSLAAMAEAYLEEGNRIEAINTAVEALTVSDGIELPYTPEAQMILTESVRAYDIGMAYKADYQFEMAGRIEELDVSSDEDVVSILDDTGALSLLDLKTKEVIKEFSGEEAIETYTFLGENLFVYKYSNLDDLSTVKYGVYDLNSNETIKEFECQDMMRLYASGDGKYLVGETWMGSIVVFDGETLEEKAVVSRADDSLSANEIYLFDDGVMAYIEKGKKPEEVEDNKEQEESEALEEDEESVYYVLNIMDLSTGEITVSHDLGEKSVEEIKIHDGVVYVASAVYEENYFGCDSYVTAIDMVTGEPLWEKVMPDCWADDIQLPINEGAENLLFITSSDALFINMKSGEILQTIAIPGGVLDARPYVNSNNFMLMCENGQTVEVMSDLGSCIDISHNFECKTTSNSNILSTKYGIVVLEKSDQKVTIYTIKIGQDVIACDNTVEMPEVSEEISGSEMSEIAKSYNLDRADYVKEMYYSQDKKYCFIQYWDNQMLVYDVEAGSISNTFEDAYPTIMCVGTDKEGYTYLLGFHGCYVLNDDMAPIMWIPGAVNVDIENRRVYIKWSGSDCYEAPIYTLDKLIEMGQNYKGDQ